MNYLQLGQELHREARYAGIAPVTLQGQTGQNGDIAYWVKRAWNDIQLMNDGHWKWLWRKFTFNTVAATDSYAYTDANDVALSAVIDRFNSWNITNWRNPPKIYLTANGVGGEQWLTYVPWAEFQQIYKIGTQNDGMPVHIAIDPQDNIVLGPIPDDIYTVSGDYWRGPQVLSADADIPECPTQYHEAITYRALVKYGYANVAQEAIMRANAEGLPILNALTMNQGATRKRFRLAPPMA